MSHIVTKRIKGHEYGYLVKSVREGSKVRQVILKYLGRYHEGIGFTRVVNELTLHSNNLTPETGGTVSQVTPAASLDFDYSASSNLHNTTVRRKSRSKPEKLPSAADLTRFINEALAEADAHFASEGRG